MKELIISLISSISKRLEWITAIGVGVGPSIKDIPDMTIYNILVILVVGVLSAAGAFLFKVIISMIAKKIKCLRRYV